MKTIVVIGGGWAGCAAAMQAARAGGRVFLLEKTDRLLGTGLAGGIMKNNGRWTVTEEVIEMGGGALFDILEKAYLHRDLRFPGHDHAALYDVTRIESPIWKALEDAGVTVLTQSRVKNIKLKKGRIDAVVTDGEEEIPGDVFIETTGSAGSPSGCKRYGQGCVMCILRCPVFGARVSLAQALLPRPKGRAGVLRGRISGACNLLKASLSPRLSQQLSRFGELVVAAAHEPKAAGAGKKSCPQYEDASYEESLIFLDNGHAKLMRPFFPLSELRRLPGLENAVYTEPFSGGRGNSIRYLSIAPVDIDLKLNVVQNLFCAGETIGPLAGHTEAIVTGILAGHNAVLSAKRKKLFSPSVSTALGDFVSYVSQRLAGTAASSEVFTFSGAVYFDRMKRLGLYRTRKEEIAGLIGGLGLRGVLT